MTETRIKINSIVKNQLPDFVKEEFPLLVEFLEQYYLSLENQGSSYDLIQNLDNYIKLDSLSNLSNSTTLTSSVSFFDSTISVESTYGFPDSYGLLLVDSEIITYTGKTQTSFTGCIRGFSGVTSLQNSPNPDELVFSSSSIEEHSSGSTVKNLSVLFLQEFFRKLKVQITPGFEDRQFFSGLNSALFIKQSKDFYSSKGTENSFKILFKALYGQDVSVIRPQEYLIQPSDARYVVTKDLVVESISGDLTELENRTVYQDQNEFIQKSRGTVTNVEKILRGTKEFYVLSLDYAYQQDIDVEGSIFGEFSIHPKTILTTSVFDLDSGVSGFIPSTTSLDVDSTVGFPPAGELVIDLQNGSQIIVSYSDKTLNQFLNCTGITQEILEGTEIKSNVYAYGYGNDEIIKFRVTGVLSDLKNIGQNASFEKNDPIIINTLGKEVIENKFNNWFFNIPTYYTCESVSLLDSSNNLYSFVFYDNHSFVIGDKVEIYPSFNRPGSKIDGTVVSFVSKKIVTISLPQSIDVNALYDVKKLVLRADSSNYPALSQYTTNVQNVYIDNNNVLYVASPSLPNYLNQTINVNDRSLIFSGSFSGENISITNHSLFTGDRVYYKSGGQNNNLGIDDGFYFVRKISDNVIQLSKSRSNLFSNISVSVSGSVTDNQFILSDFIDDTNFDKKELEPQKLIRKISDPFDTDEINDTSSGSTGILVNGVEILNYKSKDSVFYGDIESITPISSGSDYDVVNPPVLRISDAIGSGCTSYCSVKGSLKRVDVLNEGFDYLENPQITISGGNGFGAKAEANLISFYHQVEINANQNTSSVDPINSTLSFIDDHKFRDYERVVYDPQGQTVVGGLSTGSSYYVSVIDSKKVKLYYTYEDSVSGINTVPVANSGNGIQAFKSSNVKRKIGSVTVVNSGTNYENKKRATTISGINTSLDVITIQQHGYEEGSVVVYDYTENPVVGLSSTSKYYVKKLNDDQFKLSLVSTSSTVSKDINYRTNTYVNLESVGSGIHIFNYEPITLTVTGKVGVNTLSGQNFNAVLRPIIRGEIETVNVQSGGSDYGSSDILNYDRQPEFSLLNGSGCQLTPIITNGIIADVIINDPGSNYNSIPDIIVQGSGSGASLVPILSNGSIQSVKIVSGGLGYLDSDTILTVVSSGSGAKFEAKIKSWTINLFERLLQTDQITDDDGVLDSSFSGFGLQYFHLYSPRKLRSSVLSSRFRDGQLFYEPDLTIVNGKESTSRSHSPIIGWAYDGNPIYGPYGYSSPLGGSVRSMVSGYRINLKNNRPSTSIYPVGFFIDDYEFIGKGDLDEHNGRFCITPDYPDGVYAYFTTISDGPVDSVGPFKNYKSPVFPYFVGNTYKSKPIDFNFLKTSNQISFDINESGLLRNTTPYNIKNSNSGYDFLYNPNNVRKQISYVTSVSRGKLDSIGIVTGGTNYKVGDQIIFDDVPLYSKKPSAKVSSIKGKKVVSVSVATSEVTGVEFYPSNQYFVGFCTLPHSFANRDILKINTDFEDPKISSNTFRDVNILYTSTGIGSTSYTGLVTYFNVVGNLSDFSIRENDVYQINDEKVKILNIDRESSRVRVLRNTNSILGITSYSVGMGLTELPRKIYANFEVNNSYNYTKNKEIYFNPVESIGIGSTSGPGITTTLTFANPGVGITQISIPTRSIYIPNHNLNSGDELIYSSNGGSSISISTDGSSSYQLLDNSVLYATKLSENTIGISSFRVGLGTTGTYSGISTSAGLLYFTGIGSGEIHSFKTNYENILRGKISKNEVTVSTASTHNLKINDTVNVEVVPGITTNISLSYNDYNRRLITNKIDFISGDVDISNNTIRLLNHGLYTSQKVIYQSTSPSGGLINENIYYVVVVDEDTIKLSDNYYYSTRIERNIVNITTASFGSILPVNPKINLVNKNTLVFDVSDQSLSFINQSVRYSAFELNFYFDPEFNHQFSFTESNNSEIVRFGRVGIDTNATVTLKLNSNTPQRLYYKLDPVNLDIIPSVKKEIVVDNEVVDNNQLDVVFSGYFGNHRVSGIGSTTFNYNLNNTPEKLDYDDLSTILRYTTSSSTDSGEIDSISITYPGLNLDSIPKVINVLSENGSDYILEPQSNSIGNIIKTKLYDIGFNYSADKSVRPTAKLPDVLKVIPQSSIKSIGITSIGKNYTIAPNLIVLDGLTGEVMDDVDLRFDISAGKVDILRNTTGINNTPPSIIPIDNTNGIDISNITFVESSRDVIVTLGASFSSLSDFPFQVGDKVLIENVSVGVGTTLRGYNSSNYNYTLFTIKNTDPNIGGIGATVAYSLDEYLSPNELPGEFDSENSSGQIIPQKYFPIFDVQLEKNKFNKDEKVTSNGLRGIVVSWDEDNEILKVSSTDTFEIGKEVISESTNSIGIIERVTSSPCEYEVSSSSIVDKGWQTETGFLNNKFQRIHDNDYYQYFSYSLKSQVSFDVWDDAVSSLNHTSGFKKFSDLVIESSPSLVGINTDQNSGDFSGTADLSRFIDLNCVYDYDLVRENNITIDGEIKSDEIIFNSRVLQDYIESIGNRVLMIDDISDEFSSDPRSSKYSIVENFRLDSSRSIKYVTFVEDRRFTEQKQVLLVSLLHDNQYAYINQYGLVDTDYDMGRFDFTIAGDEGNLLFYPTKYSVNDYNINTLSLDIRDTIASIGSTNLGDVVFVGSATSTISAGSTSGVTIVGIASTYRSSKVLVQIGATDTSYFEFDELTLIHDGTDVIIQDYGQLNTYNLYSYSTSGIGTYYAYYSGSNINIDLIPDQATSVDYNINSAIVSISNNSSVGVGTEIFGNSKIDSSYVAISSSPTPGITTIASYSSSYEGSYCIVSIEDLTNNQYQVSEIVSVNDSNNVYLTEFGIIQSGSSIGSIGGTVTVSGNVDLTFTPNSDIDVEVRVFQNAIGLENTTIPKRTIDFTNAYIKTSYGVYEGTDTDIRREFELTHKEDPIFERYFDGSDSSIVNISNNTIRLPKHFFVTGEEIRYTYAGAGTTQAIGIATTTISGIGITDKLPSSLYVIKYDELDVKVAASASEALSAIPTELNITSVGIGTSHRFVSTNQNARVLIGIDNVIQSPIVSTSVTTILAKDAPIIDDRVTFSGITSFFGGDLIKIDDEIMRINTVGLGSTNVVLVQRSWMGTGLSTHFAGSLVTKVTGNYNIVDNKINFVTAPYGPTPIGSTTNPPDSRDFVGIETHSTFSGRSFIRSGITNGLTNTYSKNYIFDDISSGFNGITTTFTLKSNGSDITGFSTSNAVILINDIFQGPQRSSAISIVGDYDLSESAGITSVSFTGTISSTSYDVNTSNVPRGGMIVSVASTEGFGYQPLVSAGGTAVVSGFGTISSISIGNSGSGYRSGIQTVVNVGVATLSTGIPNIEFIGTAAISGGHIVSVAITNPGTGYTSTNPPVVIFDSPLSYSDIPLVYTSSSSGLGTGAVVDIVVGQGSSIISFNIKNSGYGYGQGEKLTVSIGGTVGIPTNSLLPFREFEISVDKTYLDEFTGWTIGDLQVIDPIDSLFNGIRKTFPIRIDGQQTTIRSKVGSNIEVKANLLIFINNILQVPDISYSFEGGSIITFFEAPKEGDTSKILFYRGTGDVDVETVDILESVKEGDNLRINSDIEGLKQNSRLVTDIVSTDIVETNVYPGPGVTNDETLLRPVIWCRQTEDKIINGLEIAKDRVLYEPLIYPTTNLIQNVSSASTQIFVESVKTFFDSNVEYLQDGTSERPQRKIIIISQDSLVSASATAVVSTSGTISSILISDGGIGYSTNPSVTIGNPIGLGTTQRAIASSTISIGGTVSSITVTSPGTGYTSSNPPEVLISLPTITKEIIDDVSYEGDFGIISGISTTSVGVASTGIIFDLFIPENSFLRDLEVNNVGIATTGVSGIGENYYFVVFNSNVGNGLTSLNNSGGIVGIGTSFIDNVYQAVSVSIAQTHAVGVGLTYVARVTVSVEDYNGLSGIGYSNFYGEYSWGRIYNFTRNSPKDFNYYNNSIAGISTSPIIQRYNPLKYQNYTS